jgi:membrane protein
MRLDSLRDTPIYPLASAVRGRVNSVKERLSRNFLVMLVTRTFQEMSADDATHMAAGVAFYALFSLFPLLLGLIAVMSLFLNADRIQVELTNFAADYLPGASDLISTTIGAVVSSRGALGVVAAVGLLWSGSAIFGAISRAINRAWDISRDRPIYIAKPRQLAMALGIAVLFFLSVSTTSLARATEQLRLYDVPGADFLGEGIGLIILNSSSFVFAMSIFLLIYKFIPNTKTQWADVWPGALVAGLLFEVGKNIFIIYIRRFANFESTYGSLAPVMVLLTWAYYSSLILILGAELSSEYERLRRGIGRGGIDST